MLREKQMLKAKNKSISYIVFIISAIFLLFTFVPVNDAKASPKNSKVRVSVKSLDLSGTPTTEEIMAAGQLGGPLHPTYKIKDKEREEIINLSIGEAIQEWNKHEYKKAVKLFKNHIADYPDSPWASEAVLHIGCDATYNGRYSEAEKSFNWIIEKNKDSGDEGAKILINKAKTRLANLKVFQNNFKKAKELFSELKKESSSWRDRTYASHWIQRLSRYTSNKLAILNCGTQALAHLLERDGKRTEARQVIEVLPDTLNGHSIKDLTEIASQYQYDLTAIKVSATEIQDLPLPAIIQIYGHNISDSGHYWILEKLSGDTVQLFDPQSKQRYYQTLTELSKEWSGNALVFSKNANLPGIRIADSEMSKIFGGCCGAPRPEDSLGETEDNEDPKSEPDPP